MGCVGRCVKARGTPGTCLRDSLVGAMGPCRAGELAGQETEQVRSPGAGASSRELLAVAGAQKHDLALLRVGRFILLIFLATSYY